MGPPRLGEYVDNEHGGTSTINEVIFGLSNKKQDFEECTQKTQELDASQGIIEHIGNGYVFTTTLVPTSLDHFSKLQRRRNEYEHGLVTHLKVMLEVREAHFRELQLASSSIQHDEHVNQRILDVQKVMREGSLEKLTKTKLKDIRRSHKIEGHQDIKPQMKQYMRNEFFSTYLGHEALNAHWNEVQPVSVGKHVEHVNHKLLEVHGSMMEQLPTQMVSIDVFVILAKEDVEVLNYLHRELKLFYKMECSRCQVGSQEADLVQLNLDSIQDVKVKLASMELTLYKLQCRYLVSKLQGIECVLQEKQSEINASKGQCDLVLKELYRFVEEANQILQESCQYKSWMLTAIFFMSKVQAIHHIAFYLKGCMSLLLRELSEENQNKIPEFELEHEEIGAEYVVEARSSKPQARDVQSLEQIALEDHNALLEKVECHVQEKDLDYGDLLHLPILAGKLLGPNIYCDVRIDGRTLLGTGGCGIVYKICWIGAVCAQKILKNVNDMKFQRITSSLATLSHPNVIPIYCGIIEKGEYSFVMELMPTNLHEVMKQRRIENKMHSFSFSAAIDLLLQIAEGMWYLHDQNVVHSDLRPQNVLVNHVVHQDLAKEGYVHAKLADFGLSKITNSIPLSSSDNIERIAYMAPELWEDNLRVGTPTWKAPNLWEDNPIDNLYYPKKGDIYSFGMICFEVLTGLVPFHDVSNFDALPKIICENGRRPLLPEDYPKSLVTLIRSCWVANPNCRPDFSNIAEQLRDLKQWISFACSLYGGSSSPWIKKRSEDAKEDPRARCLSLGRANSWKRGHDSMINDHINFANSMEDIPFDVDKSELPYPKFARNNFGMKMCKFPKSGYEHVKGPPMTSLGNEEMGLVPFEEPNELSSLHLQYEEDHSHSSSMETNIVVTTEEEEVDKTMCKSPHVNIDVALEDNAMDTNAQINIESIHCSKLSLPMSGCVEETPKNNNGQHSCITISKTISIEEFANISMEKYSFWTSPLEPQSSKLTIENVEDLVYGNENQLMGVQDCTNSLGLSDITNTREEILSVNKNEDMDLEAFYVEMMTSEPEVLIVKIEEPNTIQSEYVMDEMAKELSGMELMETNDETYDQNDILKILLNPRFDFDQLANEEIVEREKIVEKDEDRSWSALPRDLQEALLNKLDYKDLTQVKLASKEVKSVIESDAYHTSRGQTHTMEASLSPLYFFIKDGIWQCSGFDLMSGDWKRLPALAFLPPPEEDLFKEYFVAGGEGLLCINVSKVPHEERVIVCNLLTQKKVELPPLNSRRNPVLMHMLVNSTTKSYKVIVAGSSGMEGGLSKCTEIFDSLTWKWTRTGDIPGPEFCLNEYQTGVYINGILYCIAFMDDGSGKTVSGKGVLAYNVDEGEWISDWKCPLPSPSCRHTNSIAQLFECNGELYLFLEREHGRHVDHCIEKLECVSSSIGKWKNVVKESKSGGRGLLVYPEYTCVPHGVDKICIFNTIEHKGIVYDVVNGGIVKEIYPPSTQLGEGFHSLNPLSFTFHPNFKDKVGEKMVEIHFEVGEQNQITSNDRFGNEFDVGTSKKSPSKNSSNDDLTNKVDSKEKNLNCIRKGDSEEKLDIQDNDHLMAKHSEVPKERWRDDTSFSQRVYHGSESSNGSIL